ncbi:hypothetical protein L596_008567 [Steinernema carpocapsae]|uniref:Uncharacterized protein n=1 Tax=Steinernema carpocapsae TaxID=34508 RepID=A0A4U5PD53_STECR|nr:hypothetical protein L596_008567 [Steinernema carpocapsae]
MRPSGGNRIANRVARISNKIKRSFRKMFVPSTTPNSGLDLLLYGIDLETLQTSLNYLVLVLGKAYHERGIRDLHDLVMPQIS